MKKQLELTKEDAIKYYSTSNDNAFKALLEQTFGKDFWKPKDISLEVNDLESLTKYLKDLNFIPYPIKTRDKFQRYLNACAILVKVAEVYNEGTELDWTNTSVYKYMPYKYCSCGRFFVGPAGGWYSGLYASARLYYKNSKLSEASYNNFKEYWEDFWLVS